MADLLLTFCFNVIIVGTAWWVVLRAVEKAFDIYRKYRELEAMEEAK